MAVCATTRDSRRTHCRAGNAVMRQPGWAAIGAHSAIQCIGGLTASARFAMLRSGSHLGNACKSRACVVRRTQRASRGTLSAGRQVGRSAGRQVTARQVDSSASWRSQIGTSADRQLGSSAGWRFDRSVVRHTGRAP
ncbi:hypothetical protein HMPREF3115_13005 [Burkholderia sp. HMSC10F09]|nr:hypothetical protein HMPREF3115_13005 [Burkholderia sp. HMSC10F09]